jgi:hypothetical protein
MAAAIIPVRPSRETAPSNPGATTKVIRESAIPVSSQSGKSLTADNALMTTPEVVTIGSGKREFYI